jgi:hypothetical protein
MQLSPEAAAFNGPDREDFDPVIDSIIRKHEQRTGRSVIFAGKCRNMLDIRDLRNYRGDLIAEEDRYRREEDKARKRSDIAGAKSSKDSTLNFKM